MYVYLKTYKDRNMRTMHYVPKYAHGFVENVEIHMYMYVCVYIYIYIYIYT